MTLCNIHNIALVYITGEIIETLRVVVVGEVLLGGAFLSDVTVSISYNTTARIQVVRVNPGSKALKRSEA